MKYIALAASALMLLALPASAQNATAVAEVQTHLTVLGFDAGPIDGAFGGSTRSALRQFQRQSNLPASGRINAASRDALIARVDQRVAQQYGAPFTGRWGTQNDCSRPENQVIIRGLMISHKPIGESNTTNYSLQASDTSRLQIVWSDRLPEGRFVGYIRRAQALRLPTVRLGPAQRCEVFGFTPPAEPVVTVEPDGSLDQIEADLVELRNLLSRSESVRARLEAGTASFEDIADARADLRRRLRDVQAQLSDRDAQLSAARARATGLEDQLEIAEDDIAALEQRIADLESRQNQRPPRNVRQLRRALQQANADNEALAAENAELRTQNEQFRTQIQALQQQLQQRNNRPRAGFSFGNGNGSFQLQLGN